MMSFPAMAPSALRTLVRYEPVDPVGRPPRRDRSRRRDPDGGSVLARTFELLREAFRSSAGAAHRGPEPEPQGR